VPSHEEALGLPHGAASGHSLASQAVMPLLLGCLPPMLQVAPLQSSLQHPHSHAV